MKRGDLVTAAINGDYGKPRPALVIQSDALDGTDAVLVCLLTTTLRDAPLFRLTLPADEGTGLRDVSQVMADKIMAVRRDRCGPVVGRADDAALAALGRILVVMVGLQP